MENSCNVCAAQPTCIINNFKTTFKTPPSANIAVSFLPISFIYSVDTYRSFLSEKVEPAEISTKLYSSSFLFLDPRFLKQGSATSNISTPHLTIHLYTQHNPAQTNVLLLKQIIDAAVCIYLQRNRWIGIQGVTKRCRLSWLANSALVYEPKKMRGDGGGGVSQCTAVHNCTWSPIKLWRCNFLFNLWLQSNKVHKYITILV